MYYRNRETQKRLKKLYHRTHSHYGAGAYFDDRAGIYKRYSCQKRYWKRIAKRKARHNLKKDEYSLKGSSYKRTYDYWWQIT